MVFLSIDVNQNIVAAFLIIVAIRIKKLTAFQMKVTLKATQLAPALYGMQIFIWVFIVFTKSYLSN